MTCLCRSAAVFPLELLPGRKWLKCDERYDLLVY